MTPSERSEVERETIERCIAIAAAHKSSAAKERQAKGIKLSRLPPGEQLEIFAEERGEDIASEIIATAIRALLPKQTDDEAASR